MQLSAARRPVSETAFAAQWTSDMKRGITSAEGVICLKLVIAEKAIAGERYAAVLGASKKKNGYLEGKG